MGGTRAFNSGRYLTVLVALATVKVFISVGGLLDSMGALKAKRVRSVLGGCL